MSKVNRFFVSMCCFVLSFGIFMPNDCHSELVSESSSLSKNISAQAKADVTALLSTLSVSELITVGHEVLRLSKEQGLASTAAENFFRKTLEVIYEDVYVYGTPAPVVYEDVYVYDTPAPISVGFNVGSGSSSSQHVGPKTPADKVAEVIVAVLGVALVITIIGVFVWAAANGHIDSERVVRREIHVQPQTVVIRREWHR